MDKQYIYILSNSKYPDLIKVGGTADHPNVRASTLSRQTGAIGKFIVEWSMVVPDWKIAEKMAHFKLKEFLEEKEYFKIGAFEASELLKNDLISFFKIGKVEVFENLEFNYLEAKHKAKTKLLSLKF